MIAQVHVSSQWESILHYLSLHELIDAHSDLNRWLLLSRETAVVNLLWEWLLLPKLLHWFLGWILIFENKITHTAAASMVSGHHSSLDRNRLKATLGHIYGQSLHVYRLALNLELLYLTLILIAFQNILSIKHDFVLTLAIILWYFTVLVVNVINRWAVSVLCIVVKQCTVRVTIFSFHDGLEVEIWALLFLLGCYRWIAALVCMHWAQYVLRIMLCK